MFRLKDVSPKPPAQCYLPQLLILSLHYIYYVDKKTNVCKCRVLCLSQRCMLDAGVVGQLAALLVPGAGHSADAEVVQDAAPALQQPCLLVTRGAAQVLPAKWTGNTDAGLDTQLGGTRWNIAGATSGLTTTRAVNEPPRRFSGRRRRRSQ